MVAGHVPQITVVEHYHGVQGSALSGIDTLAVSLLVTSETNQGAEMITGRSVLPHQGALGAETSIVGQTIEVQIVITAVDEADRGRHMGEHLHDTEVLVRGVKS